MIGVYTQKWIQCLGGIPDSVIRRCTFIFGSRDGGPVHTNLVMPNQETGGAYCELSGIWFPSSRLRKDGYGRTVGDIFYTRRPKGL